MIEELVVSLSRPTWPQKRQFASRAAKKQFNESSVLMFPSFSTIIVVILLGFFGQAAYQIGGLWFPPVCDKPDEQCLLPFVKLSQERFDLMFFTLLKQTRSKVEVSVTLLFLPLLHLHLFFL